MRFFDGYSRHAKALLAAALVGLMALPTNGFAQQATQTVPAGPTKPMADLATTQSLRVIPLAGNNERNDLEHGVMAPLVVQVLDVNGRPVEGAAVVFRFPINGPSAFFAGYKNSQTSISNADGQAAATGWVANRQVGRFEVKITASHRNEIGETTVTMLNVASVTAGDKAAKKGPLSSRWVKIGIIAGIGGGVLAAVLLSRGGGSNSGSTVSITPGAPSIGGPR